MRSLASLSAAIAGLTLIIVGGFLPAAISYLGTNLKANYVSLPSTWQVPLVLVCGIGLGPAAGTIATVAYLTIGIFHLPIFTNGGGLDYVSTPSFGYLIGFVPSAWICGKIVEKRKFEAIPDLTFTALIGLMTIHLCGIFFLILGSILGSWDRSLFILIRNYSISPLATQFLLTIPVGLISRFIRVITFSK